MRDEFINPLMKKGFVECVSCGKVVYIRDLIKGMCPTCYKNQEK